MRARPLARRFGIYYKRLKDLDDAAFDHVWSQIDGDGDGILTVGELCRYYKIDAGECSTALQRTRGQEMSDEKLLEALQLQSLLNEERQRQEQQRKTHAARLKALAELVAEEDDEEDETPSPVVVTSALTLKDVIRESKRRGEISSRFFEED